MDYDELGFKCGIEIHQQVDTATKLFCDCSTDVSNESPVAQVKRRLRPVPGEEGDVDPAAVFEFVKDNSYVYNIYDDTTCLVELDEEPPHPMNTNALETALQMALMLDADIPDEIHVMRKMVIDGSNTTGFQRTAIIGLDGELETDKGTVGIPDLELEEESAGIHERDEHAAIYDLDRLGIPLIEIGTDASIQGPEHAKEVALELGMLLRSTRNVKRGLGTIRQDVNVSIAEGARVEIKGLQDVANVDTVIAKEVERQKTLVDLQDEIAAHIDAKDVLFDDDVVDVTEVVRATDNEILERVIESDGAIYAAKIPFEGFMNTELCDGKTLGKELSEYASVHDLNGIMHTDEDVERYGFAAEFETIAAELDKQEGEVIFIVAGQQDQAAHAAEEVLERAKLCLEAVPEETRSTNQDFTTSYARPLPGAARMYPETDIPPIPIDEAMRQDIRESLPETLDEKEEQLAGEIGGQLADQIVGSSYLSQFEQVVDEHDIDTKTVAAFFTNTLKDIESRTGRDPDVLTDDHFDQLFGLFEDDELSKDGLQTVAAELMEEPSKDPAMIVEEKGLGAMDDEEVRQIVQQVCDEKKEMIAEQGEHARGALMGLVMQRVGDSADGQTVSRILGEELEDRA